jgi:hypothetical protein
MLQGVAVVLLCSGAVAAATQEMGDGRAEHALALREAAPGGSRGAP